jgi:hypothetical protein
MTNAMTDKPDAKKLPEFDPALIEIVERKLAPYRGRVSPEMLEHFRQEALLLLSTHPYPAALLKQLKPPTVVDHSTSVPTADGATAEKNGSATPPATSGERSKRGRRGGR